MQKVPTLLIRP